MNKDYSRAIPANWEAMAKFFEAMGNEHRQRILLTFEKDEELSIKDIVEVSTLQRSSVVHHLQMLSDVGVLVATKKGKFTYYKINPEVVITSCKNLINYAESLR